MVRAMIGSRNGAQAALTSLEADAAFARSGFACLFANSDEYELALIARRRAEGRYRRPSRHWPVLLFMGCAMLVAGAALLLG
jgi:hypothetical protein